MTTIGIIGAGTAGLHLGLRLQQHGIPVTIYSERDPAELRSARLPNTVAHHAPTLERQRALGINHWDAPELCTFSLGFCASGPHPFGFEGRLEGPSQFMDYRVYQPRLAEDFVARGGRLEVNPVDPAGVERLAQQHDLVVVATGRAGLGHMFARMPEHSPHTGPQRLLFGGLFHGLRPLQPLRMQFNIAPGHGEIVEGRMVSVHGPMGSLFVEAIPGGAFEVLATRKPDEDLRGFEALMLKLLQEHAPATFERVDPAAFRLAGPLDWLQGSVTPVVRRAYTRLSGGRFVMAVGDTHVLHDPIAGQGANSASASGWLLAEAIHEALQAGQAFDEAFCQRAEARAWEAVRATAIWNNALLQPPPPFMAEVLLAASQDAKLAEEVIHTLMSPDRALATFSSPENCAALLARHGSSGATPAKEGSGPQA